MNVRKPLLYGQADEVIALANPICKIKNSGHERDIGTATNADISITF